MQLDKPRLIGNDKDGECYWSFNVEDLEEFRYLLIVKIGDIKIELNEDNYYYQRRKLEDKRDKYQNIVNMLDRYIEEYYKG